jgi:hypothetical protein
MTELDLLSGNLILRPGTDEPITCERPMVGAALMRRLTEGRRAALMPELVGSVFTLCAAAQRACARQAVAAALGVREGPETLEAERRLVALNTAREHLQRFALDMPRLVPQPEVALDTGWLRDAPVLALPSHGVAGTALAGAAAALPGWLERRVFGLPCRAWIERWQAAPGEWLAEWAAGRRHPFARWLDAVRTTAQITLLPCRPLAVLSAGPDAARELAAALAADGAAKSHFAERPLWRGAPAETGPWTRVARPLDAESLWLRLGARLADLAAIALDEPLAVGALVVAPGEAIAWCEMSRGLLMHWLKLEDGSLHPDSARVARYRVLAPTEWNFHPQGSLGRALAAGRLTADETRLAALTLDPCIRFDVAAEPHA